MSDKLVVAAFGGGTNSKAGLIKLVKENKQLDLVLFADTGAERPEAYCEVERFSHWLAKRGYPEIITVSYKRKDGENLTLEQDCLNNRGLPGAVFGFEKNTCSEKFKIRPQDKLLKKHLGSAEITKLIFYDSGEEHRVLKAQKYGSRKYKMEFPLFSAGISRKGCVDIIKKEGLSLPGKSSCFFCPSMRKVEIRNLARKYPELIERAIQMERNAIPNLTTIKGLGVMWSWENFLKQGEMFPECFPEPRSTEICCNCYDG